MDIFTSNKDNILIAGCGGGYDVFTGLPIYFSIIKNNPKCNIYLSNLSLTDEVILEKYPKIGKCGYLVNHILGKYHTQESFPEYYLSKELNVTVMCIVCESLKDYYETYEIFIKNNNITSIILCDGGCDSILSGVETDLGTPTEDMISMWTFNQLKKNKIISEIYLSLLGANVILFVM